MADYKILLDSINLNPYNPRQISDDHLERLKASISSHTESLEEWNRNDGYRLVDPIIINKHNKRCVAGHQRIKTLREKLDQDWVHKDDLRYVTIENEKKEAALNIALNNTGVAGEWDFPKLKDLIVEIDTGEFKLDEITGFNQPELDRMFGETVNDPNGQWQGMPEFNQEDKTAYQTIHVHFKDQKKVEAFANLIKQKITKDTRSLWYPQIEIERYADKRYEDGHES